MIFEIVAPICVYYYSIYSYFQINLTFYLKF